MSNNKESNKIITVLLIAGIATFVLFVLTIVTILVAREVMIDIQSEKEIKEQKLKWKFRDDMIARIPAGNDIAGLEEGLKDVVRYIETSDTEEPPETALINLQIAYDPKALENGIKNYNDFIPAYNLSSPFYKGEPNWMFSYEKQEFYIGYRVAINSSNPSADQMCTMVLTFDSSWKLIDIQCVEGYVDSIVRYR